MKRASVMMRPVALVAIVSTALVAACGWDPTRPFEREAPEVREAIGQLDGGDASAANDLLEEYLTTGACKEGSIGTPPRVKERSNGSFDLGLGLFRIAERYGKRFGEEESEGAKTMVGPEKESRADNVACALRVVRAVAEDQSQPVDLRARARYLEGNLLFLNAAYEDAVRAYDHALELAPGMPDGGIEAGPKSFASDPVGRDAAWNRAIALRRIEDKKDAGNDA
ncbi:MAG TPA: tetratricopeptide repeat protein, partial [Labilithrix sp.]